MMKRILSVGVAFAALLAGQQAYAVDYCVGTTNGVDNFGTGNAGAPECSPVPPTVDQAVQNASTNGTFAVNAVNIFNGSISAHIGRSGIGSGTITDRFLFTIPQTGVGSGSITTTSTELGGPTDLDFLAVSINGVAATIMTFSGGLTEVAFANVPITAGVQNVLSATYLSRGNGSYGGDLVFNPVPEPATWALMLAGFGAIGFAMRRRSKPQPKVRFAF